MRYFEIIAESPLSDFEIHGDVHTVGSFDNTDLKAMRNPKWVEKVHNAFSKTPFKFNIYIVNLPEAIIPAPDNQSHVRYRFDNAMNVREYPSIRRLIGQIAPEYAQKILEKLPPDHENSINVLLVENEGDNKIALTPFIVAHRVVHSMLAANYSIDHIITNEFWNFSHRLTNMIFGKGNRWHIAKKEEILEALALVGTTRAQRTNNLNSAGEFVIEMGAQYLIVGRIKPFRNDFSRIDDFNASQQEEIDKFLVEFNNKFNELFEELFKCEVGNFFLL